MSNEINALAFFGAEILFSALSRLTAHRKQHDRMIDHLPLKSICVIYELSVTVKSQLPGKDDI